MTIAASSLAAGTTPALTSGTAATSKALGSLTSNFSGFLSLLMTQLKNQDPSAPMDATSFTNQLVQFSSVEQQINANSNLQTLIQATQSNTILQSSSLVGKHVDVTSDHVSLQSGSATAHFAAPQAELVNIAVLAPDGTKVLQTTMQAQAGSNDWKWDGKNQHGTSLADGSYKVTITDPSQAVLSTTTTGVVTGVGRGGAGVTVSLGALTTDVSTIQSVSNN